MAPLVHMVTTPAFTRLDKKCFIAFLRFKFYISAPRGKSYRQLHGAVLIVASASPRRLLENIWRDSLTQTGYAFSIHDFARECTAAEIASIVATARAAKSAIIVGAGGGKVLDAARATIDSEFVHNEPFPVTANMVADAIMAADAAGR